MPGGRASTTCPVATMEREKSQSHSPITIFSKGAAETCQMTYRVASVLCWASAKILVRTADGPIDNVPETAELEALTCRSPHDHSVSSALSADTRADHYD